MQDLPKVLLIEDDPTVHTLVESCLGPLIAFEGVKTASDGRAKALNESFQIIIVDLHLEDGHGLSLIKELKEESKNPSPFFVILTADEGTEEEIQGHQLGVYDYIRKPVEPPILKAIIEKNLKRLIDTKNDVIKKGIILVELNRVAVAVDGEKIALTHKEYKLLLKLLQNEGRVLSRDQLLESVWSDESDSLARTVDMHISTLRKKLKSAGDYIKTVRSMGYLFEVKS